MYAGEAIVAGERFIPIGKYPSSACRYVGKNHVRNLAECRDRLLGGRNAASKMRDREMRIGPSRASVPELTHIGMSIKRHRMNRR